MCCGVGTTAIQLLGTCALAPTRDSWGLAGPGQADRHRHMTSLENCQAALDITRSVVSISFWTCVKEVLYWEENLANLSETPSTAVGWWPGCMQCAEGAHISPL